MLKTLREYFEATGWHDACPDDLSTKCGVEACQTGLERGQIYITSEGYIRWINRNA